MGIYIPGIYMPDSCDNCLICNRCEGNCDISDADYLPNKRPDDCPLIELPPHGRLIDADAFAAKYIAALPGGIDDLIDKSRAPEFLSQIQALLMDIAEAPTIIPADPKEGGADG